MAINDSDRLLINDGSKTETITLSQIRDGSMLNDADLSSSTAAVRPKRSPGSSCQMSWVLRVSSTNQRF